MGKIKCYHFFACRILVLVLGFFLTLPTLNQTLLQMPVQDKIEYIRNGETGETVTAQREITKGTKAASEANQHVSFFSHLLEQRCKNIISQADYELELNHIGNALLELLADFAGNGIIPTTIPHPSISKLTLDLKEIRRNEF